MDDDKPYRIVRDAKGLASLQIIREKPIVAVKKVVEEVKAIPKKIWNRKKVLE